MNFFTVITIAGGLAMFLYGMRLMGDALKEGSSGALKVAMESVTNSSFKAFLLGLLVTAIIQSSTGTIVITSGLVGAGILTLHQSLGIIIGANVGTTITGQIIRLLDLNSAASPVLQLFKPSTLAPVALVIGIVLIMGNSKRRTVGNVAMGFGILFTGLLTMSASVSSFATSPTVQHMFTGLGDRPVVGYITGATVAFILQSSSATIGILQALSSSGLLQFKAIYAIIVGVYLGDCVTTAIVCSIGAKADSKRVGIVNILYNLCKSALVLIGVFIAHRTGLLDRLWERTVDSSIIANTNTLFNLACALLLMPMVQVYENMARRIVKDDVTAQNKYKEKLDELSPVFFNTPALALRSCYDVLSIMLDAARDNLKTAAGLLLHFDQKKYSALLEEEDCIDLMTDRLSKYVVELLPHLKDPYHVSILNEYYKVVSEFERLGDHAVNIADVAKYMSDHDAPFSDSALQELAVLEEITYEIMDNTELSFKKRDIDAAYRIGPLEQTVEDVISLLKKHHFDRMCSGKCSMYANASFTNLMTDFMRIASVCSNVGEATIIRVKPELAKEEHIYFTSLRSGNDVDFNAAYSAAYQKYMGRLEIIDNEKPAEENQQSLPESIGQEQPEMISPGKDSMVMDSAETASVETNSAEETSAETDSVKMDSFLMDE